MKKILTLSLMAMLIGFTANAQLEIRPAAGLNFSNLSTSPDGTTTSAKVGYQFGGSLMFGKRIYLSPGIYYHYQATQYEVDGVSGGANTTSEEQIAGVKIPVLLGIRLLNPENDPILNLRIFAGPTILFNTKNEFTGSTNSTEINWNSNTWAARVGAGVDVLFLFVDAGYEFGLTNTVESTTPPSKLEDTKHNAFMVNIGFRIKL